jgi:hypothetical protein
MKNIFLFLLLVFTLACEKKVNSTNQSSSSVDSQSGSSNQNAGNNTGSGTVSEDNVGTIESSEVSCNSPGVGEQTNNYYTFEGIIAHGVPKQGGSTFWSSATDLSLFSNQSDQNIFMTDSRFNLRLLLKPAPAKNTTDSYGYACDRPPVNYQKMKFKIGIKKNANGGYIKQYTITDIPVNGCSPVIEVDLSNYTSSEPYIVEIISASWDYSCTYETELGSSSSHIEQFCPYSNVWDLYCFEVALQVATDYTKNFY